MGRYIARELEDAECEFMEGFEMAQVTEEMQVS
jgi:hypothetical protein